MKPANTQILGMTMAVMAANLFSSKVILVKLAFANGATPMQVLGVRMATALPFFLSMTIILSVGSRKIRPTKRDFSVMTMLGMLGYYFSSVLDFHGMMYVTSGMERLLLYLYPSFLVIIRSVGNRSLPGPMEILALSMAYAGAAFVYLDEHQGTAENVLLGSIMILGAALCFAFYMYFSQNYIRKFGSMFYASYSTTVSCVAILIHSSFSFSGSAGALSGVVIFLCVITGIFSTVLPTYFMHYAIALIGSSKCGILGTTGIICPLILGVLLFSEPLTFSRITGTVMVLAAVVLLGRRSQVKPFQGDSLTNKIELSRIPSTGRTGPLNLVQEGKNTNG